MTYCSAGQLSPLLNDPWYRTIGVGTSVWLAGARGLVYAEGTQHAPSAERGENGVPVEGAGTLALTGNMKEMNPKFVRGASLKGYGASLSLGVGIPIPILDLDILKGVCVRDSEIQACIVDYAGDYPNRTGQILGKVSYAQLRTGEVTLRGKTIPVSSMSSYYTAREVATLLKDAITAGDFLLSAPSAPLPVQQRMKPLNLRGASR